MSQAQRVIVRMGVEADIPSMHFGELGFDTDTLTLRVGDDTPVPVKIMSTKSTGIFDYSTVEKIILPNVEFAPGAGFAGINFDSLKAAKGIVISLGDGEYRQTSITSSDNSVVIANGQGQSGTIDLRVSSASITNALGDIRQQLLLIGERIDDIDESMDDNDDTLLKLVQLTGRPAKFTELGTFLGTIIPDNATIKTALQALETAIGNADGSNIELEIVGRNEIEIGLQLNDDNIVVLESATADLAGLMSANDKYKLDFITVSSPIVLEGIQVTAFIADEETVLLENSNDSTVEFPIVSDTYAGAMLPVDKKKLDFISATKEHDIDNLENRVELLEEYTFAPTFFAETGVIIARTTANTGTLRIDGRDRNAMVLYYDRTMNGYEFEVYDEIVANGIEIVPAENVTKSYRGAVQFFRARTGDWYYLNQQGIAVFFMSNTDEAQEIAITPGTTNAFEVRELTLL